MTIAFVIIRIVISRLLAKKKDKKVFCLEELRTNSVWEELLKLLLRREENNIDMK